MATLFELTIKELPAEGKLTPFGISLARIAGHPPHYRISEGLLVDTGERTALGEQTVTVETLELEAGSIAGLAAGVVGGPLYPEWVAQSEPPHPYGAFDWSARRLVIETGALRLGLPWEQIADGLQPERIALVRRSATPTPPINRYLDRRIDIAYETDGLPADHTRVLDEFVVQAGQRSNTVAWDVPPDASDLWHLSAPSVAEAALRLRAVRGPRVLVIQITQGPVDLTQESELASAAFEQGFWAVVIAALPDASTTSFFHTFYRKLMHNLPIEFCVQAGLESSGLPGYPVRLYARPGGELALSLTRIPAEMALTPLSAIPQESAHDYTEFPVPPAAPPGHGPPAPGGARRMPSRSARPGKPALDVARAALPHLRRARVVDDIARRVERTAQSVHAERFETDFAEVNDLQFVGEIHDNEAVARVASRIREAVAAEASLIEDVAAHPPGPRFTNVTFFEGKLRLDSTRPLTPDTVYRLEVAIEPATEGAHVTERFDESALTEEFKRRDTVELNVVVFSPAAEFALPNNQQTLVLPRVGASAPARFEVTPRHTGWCALRVAIYYRNTMLQSLAVRAFAGTPESMPADAVPTIRRDLDWAATTDLQLLDDLAQPVVSIFANDAPDGSHWIGVFSQQANALKLRSGDMWKLDAQDLTARVADVRKRMQACHGEQEYRYPPGKPPADPEVVKFGSTALVELAKIGRLAYESLLDLSEGTSEERLEAFDDALRAEDGKSPGIISIARCDSKWSAPWSVLYDKHLDLDRKTELHICPVAEKQIAGNVWANGKITKKLDLLDSPARCRAQAACPLNDQARKAITVCPLGFWGFRFQIEQPLQHVSKTPSGQVPGELAAESFNQSSLILRPKRQKIRVGAGAYPFPLVDRHRAELESIKNVSVEWESERPKVLNLLYQPKGHHLIYFFCHGREVDEVAFALQVGPKEDPANTISPASIDRELVRWGGENPQPLVVVIACESLAARPELAHDLFAKLRRVKASGVLGTEISVGLRLGKDLGLSVMNSVAAGVSVGEALLQLRLDMLRRFNPLGLALTANAPATLHLCDDPAGKGSCRRYHTART
ncbi:MAG: hypothetical protein ACT4OM_03025 [Actinomycetota bacterium]